ncbi:LysR family transcriptional regulator [Cupriavidus basilensis]|uniref:LysR family transcriptional regulator n=1 Tax=Cupriavidus basilensis TaxID=68895 RepID=UPI0004474697|nr:LysR family transcriptional regulator [Cupriavidus basilensis]MDF3882188.1 LysR family transcriptional regulator [Cupriavidus basilensis]
MSSIRTLKTFLAVARCGTFAAAGKQIGLTPAAVGLQIRALEEDLNCQLFDRNARAAILNPAGRALVPELEALVQRYESLASGQDDGLSGTVAIGALVSVLMGAFADALWAIKQEHPRLDVRLFAGLSADFALKVEHGELDAAVVTRSPRPLPRNLVWTELYTEPMVLIVPRHPHFFLPADGREMLAEAPFIRFEPGTWTGNLVQEVLDQCGVTVNESMQLNSNEAIIELVRQGFGISIVPRLANVTWEGDSLLRLVPLDGVDVRRRVGLLERSTHARLAFTDVIKGYFRQSGAIRGGRQPEAARDQRAAP